MQFLGGGAVYLLPGSQACVLSNASVTAADAYSLAVKVTVSFPAAMLGQLSVQAYGTDEQGHAGPLTEVTKFTVTGVPVPALMSAGSSSFLVQSYQWTQGVQPVVLVNGAVGPVTVSGTQVLYPQYCPGYLVGPQASMTGAQTATLVSYGYVPYNSCLFATYNLSAPGLAPVLNAVYYGAALNPYFNIGVRQVLYSVPQGGSVTVPVTFTPAMGYSGPVQLGVYAPPGIAASWDVSGVSLDGVNAGSGNLTLAVDPGLARGTYAVMIPGGPYAGNSGYLFVTVTPNTVPDFVLSPITSVSVTAGQAVSFSARVNSVAGFNGAVTVSSPGVAGAVGLTFSPNTTGALTAAGAAVAGTVATFASTPSCGQPYVVPVTAVSGGITHSGTVSVMVHGGPAPGFTVSGPPGLLTVTQGTTGSVGVTITSSACFSGAATYSAASVADVAMAAPANGSVTVNGTGSVVAGFTFFAPMGMPAGTYSGTATVTINGISHAASFSVKVVPAPPPLTVTPQAVPTITVGNSGKSGGTILTLVTGAGVSGSPSVSLSGLPAGVTANISQTGVPASSSVQETLTLTTANVAAGTYSGKVIVNVAGATQSAAVVLDVVAGLPTITNMPLDHPTRLEVNLGPTPIDKYDGTTLNCLDTADCATNVASRYVAGCDPTETVRQCYVDALSGSIPLQKQGYATAQVTGVRFQFAFCGGWYSTALTGCGLNTGTLSSTWAANLAMFYSDIYNSGIRNITPTPAWSGFEGEVPVPTDQNVDTTSLGSCDIGIGTADLQWWPAVPYPFVGGADYGFGKSNHAYNCAPPNHRNFVGWDRLYSVIDAVIKQAQTAGLTIEEFDLHNELDLVNATVQGRFIVDNTALTDGSPEPVFGVVRLKMAAYGFDPYRVTASVTDGGGSTVPGYSCGSVYGDSARVLPLSELYAGLGGGVIGLPDDPSWVNNLHCGSGYGTMVSLPMTYQLPKIADMHTGPCLIDSGSGLCVQTQSQAVAAGEAQLTLNHLQALLQAYCPGGWRQGVDARPCQALVMLGEVPLYQPRLESPYVNCDFSPVVVPAATVQGFNASTLSGRVAADGSSAGVVFRVWTNPAGHGQSLPNQTGPVAVACYGFPAPLQPTYQPQ